METKQLQKSVDELRRLRDEIRVQLHLAGLDAKSFWEGLEPKLAEVESKLEHGVDATVRYADIVVDELAKALRQIRDRFTGTGDESPSN